MKSNKAGKDWIEVNDNEERSSNKLYKIKGSYENVYFAYKDKGDQCANNSQYSKALEYFKKGNNYFTLFHTDSKEIKEKSFSYANMAYCYKKMKNYKIADSLYLLAINKYKTISKTPDYNQARLFNEFANSLSNQMQFNASNLLYKLGNAILEKNLAVKKNKVELISSYNDMAKNYFNEDSLGNALHYIKKGILLDIDKTNEEYIATYSLYGTYFYKTCNYKKAEYYVTKSIKSYKSINESNSIDTADCYLMLGYINCASAKYSDARKNLTKGITIIEKKFGSQNQHYLSFLLALANLNDIEGNYLESEKQYNEVLSFYTNTLGSENNKLIAPLIGLSSIEITLSKFNMAKELSDRATSIVKKIGLTLSPKITEVINNDAYVDYCRKSYKSSELSYRKVIKINNNFGLQQTVTTANAFNGIGLIAMAQNNYPKADSLFTASLQLHKTIFTDQNPLTATVYLNISQLNILQGKLKEAEENMLIVALTLVIASLLGWLPLLS